MPKITLIGLHNFTDGDIWANMKIPDGPDPNVLHHKIMLEYGEFEVLYASPEAMKFAIENWSNCYLDAMTNLWATTQLKYDPIYNYDRYETETETPNITKNTNTNTNVTSSSNSSSSSNTTDSVNVEHTVSAFDSSSYSPSTKDDTRSSGTVENAGESSATTGGDTTATETETGTRVYERRAYGNIGVTTSQQMLEAERNINDWSWYDTVAKMFARDLLIPVYW